MGHDNRDQDIEDSIENRKNNPKCEKCGAVACRCSQSPEFLSAQITVLRELIALADALLENEKVGCNILFDRVQKLERVREAAEKYVSVPSENSRVDLRNILNALHFQESEVTGE